MVQPYKDAVRMLRDGSCYSVELSPKVSAPRMGVLAALGIVFAARSAVGFLAVLWAMVSMMTQSDFAVLTLLPILAVQVLEFAVIVVVIAYPLRGHRTLTFSDGLVSLGHELWGIRRTTVRVRTSLDAAALAVSESKHGASVRIDGFRDGGPAARTSARFGGPNLTFEDATRIAYDLNQLIGESRPSADRTSVSS